MAKVLVVGAGVSGCTVAYTLAERGVSVTLFEKSDRIGGKVRSYGCKAVDGRCQNCGVCLTTGLWEKVENHPMISLKCQGETLSTDTFDAVVVSTGFERYTGPSSLPSHLHIENTAGLMTGTELEKLLLERTKTNLFEKMTGFKDPPSSVAFIQCVGSRDINEGGIYCSRVCCSYSTRAAKLIRSYYPDCEIVFFYMEMQNVEGGNYFTGLCELGIEFINCRPISISGGEPVVVEYDSSIDGEGHGIKSREFDIVVLSDGIHANSENDKLAEVYGLSQDKDGFLYAADNFGSRCNVYVTGTARAPMKIDEAHADSLAVAGKILSKITQQQTDCGVSNP